MVAPAGDDDASCEQMLWESQRGQGRAQLRSENDDYCLLIRLPDCPSSDICKRWSSMCSLGLLDLSMCSRRRRPIMRLAMPFDCSRKDQAR